MGAVIRTTGSLIPPQVSTGCDLQLTRYDARGWRATFYTSGMEHSLAHAFTWGA